MQYTFIPGDDIPAESFQTIDPDNPVAQSPAQLIGANLFEKVIFDILLVGGGGSAGRIYSTNYYSGGGGGGGLVYIENKFIKPASYPIVVGNGGAGKSNNGDGNNGEDTTGFNLTAKGGGGGGGGETGNGKAGGCGGGANAYASDVKKGGVANQKSQAGDSGLYGFGENGADSVSSGRAGGGGGALSAGNVAPSNNGVGAGGTGKNVFGTVYSTGGNGGNSDGANGGANTGNGGNARYGDYNSGAGGSGIVVVRYLTSSKPASITITGGTITVVGDYTYHTFTSNGTLEISSTDYATVLQNFIDLANGDNNGKFTANIDGVVYEDIFVSSRIDSSDDFSSDLSKWTITQGGSSYFSIISGKLHVIDMENNQDCRIELNTTFSPNLKYIFEWNNVYLPSSGFNTCSYIFGLSSFYFSYDADQQKIYIYENNSNVQEISMAYNSTHSFKIEFLGDGKALFYIDGSLVRTGTYTASTTQTLFISINDDYGMSGDLTFEEVVAYRTVISYDEIATELQTVIRAATSKLETVVWNTDHFEITSTLSGKNSGSSVLKLQSPTTGTDISGAGYLDLGANATEVAGDGDDYKLVRLDENGNILKSKILSSFKTISSIYTRTSALTERSTQATEYTKLKEIEFNDVAGTIQVSFDLKSGSSSAGRSAYGRIYKNGVAVGTERSTLSTSYVVYTEDIAVVPGDLIQLYCKQQNASYVAYCQNFKLNYDFKMNVEENVVNTN